MQIPRREKPEPRNLRRKANWTESARRKFLAYAEYLKESDDLDYALMAMTGAIYAMDADFAAWLKTHPQAGELDAQAPKRHGKAKKSGAKAAA